jgi:hypothetical protein
LKGRQSLENLASVRLKSSTSSPFLLDGRSAAFDDKNHLPTIMVFIIGGMTHSEIRSQEPFRQKVLAYIENRINLQFVLG